MGLGLGSGLGLGLGWGVGLGLGWGLGLGLGSGLGLGLVWGLGLGLRWGLGLGLGLGWCLTASIQWSTMHRWSLGLSRPAASHAARSPAERSDRGTGGAGGVLGASRSHRSSQSPHDSGHRSPMVRSVPAYEALPPPPPCWLGRRSSSSGSKASNEHARARKSQSTAGEGQAAPRHGNGPASAHCPPSAPTVSALLASATASMTCASPASRTECQGSASGIDEIERWVGAVCGVASDPVVITPGCHRVREVAATEAHDHAPLLRALAGCSGCACGRLRACEYGSQQPARHPTRPPTRRSDGPCAAAAEDAAAKDGRAKDGDGGGSC